MDNTPTPYFNIRRPRTVRRILCRPLFDEFLEIARLPVPGGPIITKIRVESAPVCASCQNRRRIRPSRSDGKRRINAIPSGRKDRHIRWIAARRRESP